MKKFSIFLLLLLTTNTQAYTIGNKYFKLVDCSYMKYGHQWGYVGTYVAHDGESWRQFFGGDYCAY